MSFHMDVQKGLEFGLCHDAVSVEQDEDYSDEHVDYNYSKTLFVYGAPEESEEFYIYDEQGETLLKTVPKFSLENPFVDISFLKRRRFYIARFPKSCKFTCVWYLNNTNDYDYNILKLTKDQEVSIEYNEKRVKTFLLISGQAEINVNDSLNIEMQHKKFYRKTKKENVTLKAKTDNTFIAVLFRK